MITNNYASDVAHRLSVHLYHTNDSMLVQSSTSMSPGMSASTWFVKNFIEHIISSHITANEASIIRINDNLLSSADVSCEKCQCPIQQSASRVKELPVTCRPYLSLVDCLYIVT